jgi:hypothetical protein
MTAAIRKVGMTTWEGIWYVMQNIAFGAGYFGKIPAKKAMSDFGLTELTGAEHFWYIIQCIAFGAGYFAKIPTAKALSELPQFRDQRQGNFDTLAQAPPGPSVMPPPTPIQPAAAQEPYAPPQPDMPTQPVAEAPLSQPTDIPGTAETSEEDPSAQGSSG